MLQLTKNSGGALLTWKVALSNSYPLATFSPESCEHCDEAYVKDALFLVLAAAGVALIAWGFWRFAGDYGFGVVSTTALLALTVDNIRLRRQLRARPKEVR